MANMLALVPPLPVDATRTRKPNRRPGSCPTPSGWLPEITALLAGKSSADILTACLSEGFGTEAALALTGALAVLEASAPA